MKYKCLIFDLDGTLLDSLQGILDAANLSFKEMGYLVNYQRIQSEGTKPFKGISELLEELQGKGYYLAIASNKPQILLDPIVKQLFPNVRFKAALGQRINKPEKPDPHIIFEIMDICKVNPDDCVYIGDSEYDYKTAYNAGIDSIICKYGFGFYDQPWVNKTTYQVDSVKELRKLLLK